MRGGPRRLIRGRGATVKERRYLINRMLIWVATRIYSYIGLPICFEIKIKRVCVQWTLHNCCNSCDHCNIYGHNLSFMVVFLIHSFMSTTISNWKIFIRLKLFTYIRYVIVARFCIYILAFFHSSYFGVCTCTYTSRYLFSV